MYMCFMIEAVVDKLTFDTKSHILRWPHLNLHKLHLITRPNEWLTPMWFCVLFAHSDGVRVAGRTSDDPRGHAQLTWCIDFGYRERRRREKRNFRATSYIRLLEAPTERGSEPVSIKIKEQLAQHLGSVLGRRNSRKSSWRAGPGLYKRHKIAQIPWMSCIRRNFGFKCDIVFLNICEYVRNDTDMF